MHCHWGCIFHGFSWFFLVFFENRRRGLARLMKLYKMVILTEKGDTPPPPYIANYQLVPHIVRELAISYLRHYKSDFDAVKSKVGLLDEYIPSSYKASLQLVPHKVRELAISYLSLYRSDFDAVKSKVGLLYEYIPTIHSQLLASAPYSAGASYKLSQPLQVGFNYCTKQS